jgi:hypothetical protein
MTHNSCVELCPTTPSYGRTWKCSCHNPSVKNLCGQAQYCTVTGRGTNVQNENFNHGYHDKFFYVVKTLAEAHWNNISHVRSQFEYRTSLSVQTTQ